jgi:hypothetical protein
VGYVPVLKPLLRPIDNPVVLLPLLIPVVPVFVELPTLLEPAAPAAVSPLVPPPPAPCAKAMDEVKFHCGFSCHVDIESDGPSILGGVELGPSLGSCR